MPRPELQLLLRRHEKDPWRARAELSGDSEPSPEFRLHLHLIPIHLKVLSHHRTGLVGEGDCDVPARSCSSPQVIRPDGDP